MKREVNKVLRCFVLTSISYDPKFWPRRSSKEPDLTNADLLNEFFTDFGKKKGLGIPMPFTKEGKAQVYPFPASKAVKGLEGFISYFVAEDDHYGSEAFDVRFFSQYLHYYGMYDNGVDLDTFLEWYGRVQPDMSWGEFQELHDIRWPGGSRQARSSAWEEFRASDQWESGGAPEINPRPFLLTREKTKVARQAEEKGVKATNFPEEIGTTTLDLSLVNFTVGGSQVYIPAKTKSGLKKIPDSRLSAAPTIDGDIVGTMWTISLKNIPYTMEYGTYTTDEAISLDDKQPTVGLILNRISAMFAEKGYRVVGLPKPVREGGETIVYDFA